MDQTVTTCKKCGQAYRLWHDCPATKQDKKPVERKGK